MCKVTLKNSRGKNLIGLMKRVHSDTMIILVHGFTNDKSSDGRFERLMEALNQCGFDAFAFDFSGSGESDDDALTLEHQTDDLSSIIAYVINQSYKNIALFGNSFGTLACLKNDRDEISTMVLTGAVTDKMSYKWEEHFSENQLSHLKEKGYFYLDNDRKHLIVQQTLKDFEEVNQEALLKGVQSPLLLIHGNHYDDLEEQMLLSHSEKAIKKLPNGSRLEVIADGKHGLHQQWDDVIRLTCDWYKQYFDDAK